MEIKEYYEILAQNLRVERARKKISQLKLAIKAGVSVDTINLIERAAGNPTLYTIIAIAQALEVDLNTLIPIKNGREKN